MHEIKLQINPEKSKPMVFENITFRSLHDFELTEGDLEKARLELGETEEVKNACLQKLKELLCGEEGATYLTDERYLLKYLRYSKYDCDKAYRIIRKVYLSKKKDDLQMFTIPPDIDILLDTDFTTFLPYRDEDGSIIAWVKCKNWDVEKITYLKLIQISTVLLDIMTVHPASQINGITAVWDMDGMSMRHLMQCIHPSNMKMLLKIIQEFFPWRVKYIILFNTNNKVRKVYNAFSFLLKKKIADRVKILGSDLNELHQLIHPAVLSKEHGGNLEESECLITQYVMDNLPVLRYERNFASISNTCLCTYN